MRKIIMTLELQRRMCDLEKDFDTLLKTLNLLDFQRNRVKKEIEIMARSLGDVLSDEGADQWDEMEYHMGCMLEVLASHRTPDTAIEVPKLRCYARVPRLSFWEAINWLLRQDYKIRIINGSTVKIYWEP